MTTRSSERETGTRHGVTVTVETLNNGERFATTTYRGESHGMSIPPDTEDPICYAAAAARGIAAAGVDGRKGPVAVYDSGPTIYPCAS